MFSIKNGIVLTHLLPSLILLMRFLSKSEQSPFLIPYRPNGVSWGVKPIRSEPECFLLPHTPIQLR
jgi:hypothetical protein